MELPILDLMWYACSIVVYPIHNALTKQFDSLLLDPNQIAPCHLPLMTSGVASYNTFTLEIDDTSFHTSPLHTITNGSCSDIKQWQIIDTDYNNEIHQAPRLVDRVAQHNDDVVSIASDTTMDSFEILQQWLDHMMADMNDDIEHDAYEPIASDFNGTILP